MATSICKQSVRWILGRSTLVPALYHYDRGTRCPAIAPGRLNGPKAKGTKTPEGKSGYALNAVKHGLGAKRIVLANEVHRNFDRLLNVFFERFQPIDEVECELVTDIVMAKWRHRRACCIEAAMVDQQLAKDRPQQDLEYSVLTEDIRCALAYQRSSAKAASSPP
jgi:hypothetical protein